MPYGKRTVFPGPNVLRTFRSPFSRIPCLHSTCRRVPWIFSCIKPPSLSHHCLVKPMTVQLVFTSTGTIMDHATTSQNTRLSAMKGMESIILRSPSAEIPFSQWVIRISKSLLNHGTTRRLRYRCFSVIPFFRCFLSLSLV